MASPAMPFSGLAFALTLPIEVWLSGGLPGFSHRLSQACERVLEEMPIQDAVVATDCPNIALAHRLVS